VLSEHSLLASALQGGHGSLSLEALDPHSKKQHRLLSLVLVNWHCTSKGAALDRGTTEDTRELGLEFKFSKQFAQVAEGQTCRSS
jgi:hypothetical protein